MHGSFGFFLLLLHFNLTTLLLVGGLSVMQSFALNGSLGVLDFVKVICGCYTCIIYGGF